MYKAKDMCAAMGRLTDKLNIRNNINCTVGDIHALFIFHVVDLAVKDCWTEVHEQINQIRSLLSVIRPSVKQRDIYKTTQPQL